MRQECRENLRVILVDLLPSLLDLLVLEIIELNDGLLKLLLVHLSQLLLLLQLDVLSVNLLEHVVHSEVDELLLVLVLLDQ